MAKHKADKYEARAAEPASVQNSIVCYLLYYLTLGLILAAAFVPHIRVWGLNHWAYYPPSVAIGLFVAGAILPIIIRSIRAGSETVAGIGTADEVSPVRKFILWVTLLIAVYLISFYLLRARTHFLGDGYLLLGNLPTVNPWIKIRNLGEEVIHKLVYSLLSGEESARSLLSYQVVSYASGLVFLVSVAAATRLLFENNARRILFFLGMTSSGYMLLFFGYVENYSIFVTAVAIYTLMGVLILTGWLKRWYILIPLVLATATHTFGVMLIPSALFLLASGTSLESGWKRLSFRSRISISAGVAILLIVAFLYFYLDSLFFRLALVPIVENRFTIEHYTLFSLNHIVDIINLCFVLLPPFPLLAAAGFTILKRQPIQREVVFLLILTLSTLVAVVLFDPKLGMPRDWDLFAFFGVSLAVPGYYVVLGGGKISRSATVMTVMAIFLGFAVLIPRAVGRALGDIEVRHVENYIQLDVKKNKNIIWLIRDRFQEKGDQEKALQIEQQWQRNYPERAFNDQAVQLKMAGRYSEAIPYFRKAMKENPMHAPTYAALAECYRQVGMYDSAATMLAIADGINPNSAAIILEQAYTLRLRGDYMAAEEHFQRALTIDNRNLNVYLGLLELYWTTGQIQKHNEMLARTAAHPDAPAVIHSRLADVLMARRMYRDAETQYRLAISKGLDSSLIQDRLEQLKMLNK